MELQSRGGMEREGRKYDFDEFRLAGGANRNTAGVNLWLRPLAAAEDVALMASEVRTLGSHQLLHVGGHYQVYAARRYQVPSVVCDIGRLRELSLRGTGDGTGLARDLDAYDDWYTHLFVWDSLRREVVGAHRLALTDAVLSRQGPEGLSIAESFCFDPGFFARLGPAIHLGRSFVRPDCVEPSVVIDALWQGLQRFASDRPQCRTLLGSVSVPGTFSLLSRRLIAQTLLSGSFRHRLSGLLEPRRRLAGAPLRELPFASHEQGLAARVSELEPDGGGLPPLLREYLRLKAQFLGFSASGRNLSSIVGLGVVNLETPNRRLPSFDLGGRGVGISAETLVF